MVYLAEQRPRRVRWEPARAARPSALERRLSEAQAARTRIDSVVRALLDRRNRAMASALADRVPVSRVSKALGISNADVRLFGGTFRDLDFSGAPAQWHLAELSAVAREIDAALASRDAAERGLRARILEATRGGRLDVFRIAAVLSLPPERVSEMVRSARKQPQDA